MLHPDNTRLQRVAVKLGEQRKTDNPTLNRTVDVQRVRVEPPP